MNAWIWTYLVLEGISMLARLICLAIGTTPKFTRAGLCIDVAANGAMIVWLVAVWK